VSSVIDSRKLGNFAWTLGDYSRQFHEMLESYRIQQAIVDPFQTDLAPILEEEIKVWLNWWDQTGKRWSIPTMRLHRIPANLRAGLAVKWAPPSWWPYTPVGDDPKVVQLQRWALKQFPQQRVRIADPTDRFGKKRSIRVHFAEKEVRR